MDLYRAGVVGTDENDIDYVTVIANRHWQVPGLLLTGI